MHDLKLGGCTPEPLLHYLKALGVLRIVAEQEGGDAGARGAWRANTFVLQSRFDESSLRDFFLNAYCPAPILASWNAGAGFYSKWDVARKRFKSREAVDALEAVASSTSSRLAPYRSEIGATKLALGRLGRPVDVDAEIHGLSKKERDKLLNDMMLFKVDEATMNVGKGDKDQFLAALRSRVLSDVGLSWLDAAVVILSGRAKNRAEVPTLGSGGNVGNSDFSALFLQTLPRIVPFNAGEPPPPGAERLLRASLFGEPVSHLETASIGQFDPGKAGGANAGQGMDAAPRLNPWDYMLMIEGSLLLAGAVSRRIGAAWSAATFPFIVQSSGVGYGSAGKDTTRGELWLPLWSQPTSPAELRLLFGEGRAEYGRRRADNGVTFAQAVATLGVDRGLEGFMRYEFQERLGQSYLASSLGFFEVRPQAQADLLQELDPWLDRFRRACRTDDAPPRFASAIRRIDAAIFDFCRYGGAPRMAEVLRALGNAEQELAGGEKFRKTEKRTIHPAPILSDAWREASTDESPEFRLARSLAFIVGEGPVGELRTNLEPVVRVGKGWGWIEGAHAVVWSGADLARNLLAVLTRRLMDGNRAGLESLPLDSRPFEARPSDVAAFIAGETDDRKLSELIWGLILIEGGRVGASKSCALPQPRDGTTVPRAYALLKLLFLPRGCVWPNGTDPVPVRPEPELLGRLRAGDLKAAVAIAVRRLRASGFVPMPGPSAGLPRRSPEFRLEADVIRLAAALLFPVSQTDELAGLVLRPRRVEDDSALVE